MIKAVALIFGVALCVSCARAGGPGRAALSAGLAGLGSSAAEPAPLPDGAPGTYSAAPSLAGTQGASAPVPPLISVSFMCRASSI